MAQLKQVSTHLWVPNLFEFKGGIQVYLQDFLTVLAREFPNHEFKVLDKLDKFPPQQWTCSNHFSHSPLCPQSFLQSLVRETQSHCLWVSQLCPSRSFVEPVVRHSLLDHCLWR